MNICEARDDLTSLRAIQMCDGQRSMAHVFTLYELKWESKGKNHEYEL